MAAVVTMSAMVVAASAAHYEDGYVLLGFGDADWKFSMWGKDGDTQANIDDYQTPVKITGNGTYTITVDLSAGGAFFEDEETGEEIEQFTANGIGAMGLSVWGMNEEMGMDITSVKFDGVEFPLVGRSFTNPEDEGKRSNVYNPWASFKAEEHLTLDPATATGAVIDINGLGEWTTCEVTFDVYGFAGAVDEAATTEAAAVEVTAGNTNTATASKGSADTGIEGIAVVLGLAVIAAGAVVISKKSK